jgi:disulfide bond formation protein DsbB
VKPRFTPFGAVREFDPSVPWTEPHFSLADGESGVSQPRDRVPGTRLTPRSLLAAGGLVALVATSGSLYLSLGLGLIPCELCWYQRILMYPLVVVFGVALLEERPTVYRTVLPLSLLGGSIAAYHSWLQVTASGLQCGVGGSCAAVLLRVFGLTIPNLSLVAFLLVTVTAIGLWRLDTPK